LFLLFENHMLTKVKRPALDTTAGAFLQPVTARFCKVTLALLKTATADAAGLILLPSSTTLLPLLLVSIMSCC
jgi:hypothetical protein